VLFDWDSTCHGHRELDLIQLRYAQRRFGRTTEELDALAAAYGWEIRDWEGLNTLIATRELSGLASYVRTAPDKPFSRHELAHRVDTLRRGETTARWNAPAS
jgi:hypothetical protein